MGRAALAPPRKEPDMKNRFVVFLAWLLLMSPAMAVSSPPSPLVAQMKATAAQNGLNYTWNASTSAATCLATATPACVGGYNIYIGTAPGAESTIPANTALLTTTAYSYSAANLLGTTVCAVVRFQETIGALVLTSPNSNEVCFSFPNAPAAPTGLADAAY
jgi:hypothetical protein